MRVLTGIFCLCATVAQAEFTPPQGCTAYLTVQSKSCQVSHHYTCAADPEGFQWRVDMDGQGAVYASQIDGETQWINSYDILGGIVDRLEPNPNERASFTDLLETGRDDYDFATITNDGTHNQFTGWDRLTGETVVIDGVELLRTENQIVASDSEGNFQWAATGYEYIHPEWRLFFSGKSTWTTADGSGETDGTPVEFITPDEPGFLSETPKFDCADTLS